MESWVLASGLYTLQLGENIGMVGLENQNKYNCRDTITCLQVFRNLKFQASNPNETQISIDNRFCFSYGSCLGVFVAILSGLSGFGINMLKSIPVCYILITLKHPDP